MFKTPIRILAINGIFFFEDLPFDMLGCSRSTSFRSALFLIVGVSMVVKGFEMSSLFPS